MINIVYFATPEISVNTLLELIKTDSINVMAVVTPPDKPQGRKMILTPPPVKIAAQENKIPVYQTKSIRKDDALSKTLKDLAPDFFVTFAFGQILSQEVLDIPKFGTINVHASLLPKYRGANPIQHAIVNGDKITGITTMLTSLGMDEGDMCLKEEIVISENMTDIELRKEISSLAPSLLMKTLRELYNKTLTPVKQNPDEATYAGKFQKPDGLIDFNDSAKNIHNKVRGLLSWPGCYFEFKGKKVKILSTEIIPALEKIPAGNVMSIEKDGIIIATGDGNIKIKEVQPESKNKMRAYDWNNSVHLKTGEIIC